MVNWLMIAAIACLIAWVALIELAVRENSDRIDKL